MMDKQKFKEIEILMGKISKTKHVARRFNLILKLFYEYFTDKQREKLLDLMKKDLAKMDATTTANA